MVTTDEALSILRETVGAEFGPLKATVEQQAIAIAGLEGYAAGRWSVLADVHGNVAGLVLFNGGASTRQW